MKKKKSGSSRNKIIMFCFIMCLVIAGALIAYYQFMRRQHSQQAEKTPSTEVEKLIAKDIENGYPDSPTEVMKLWGRITQCLYNNAGGDDVEKLVQQIRVMYSSELLEQNQEKAHLDKVKTELDNFRENKIKILNYSVDAGSNVQYKTVNNRECAYICFSSILTQKKRGYMKMYQDFILAKEDGKWKVIGFQEVKQEPASEEEAAKSK